LTHDAQQRHQHGQHRATLLRRAALRCRLWRALGLLSEYRYTSHDRDEQLRKLVSALPPLINYLRIEDGLSRYCHSTKLRWKPRAPCSAMASLRSIYPTSAALFQTSSLVIETGFRRLLSKKTVHGSKKNGSKSWRRSSNPH